MDAKSLLSKIAPPLDAILAESLIREFIDVERRYVLGDWEPATLDGGQFAEIGSRVVYHVDSGNLNRTKGVDPCLKYVEDEQNTNNHSFPLRRTALHMCKVLRTLYKFRSQRGAVHIDPDYSANELDSMFIVAMVRWTMSEVLRVFWTGSTKDVAQAVREIVRFEVPAILTLDGRSLVLRTDCTVEQEVLILLHNSGESGLSRSAIGQAIPKSAPSVTTALKKLASPSMRQVIRRQNSVYILTPNGTKRVREELGEKLSLA